MLRRGPGADDVGRAWVERNLPEQPKVVPPGVFVCAADGRLLGHLPYRAPPADWLRLLEAISGVAQGTPFRDARPGLARLEDQLRRGVEVADALADWLSSHPTDHEGALWAWLLLGAARYRAGDVDGARALWRRVAAADHPLRHRAEYHLRDQRTWPTRMHADLGDVPSERDPAPARSGRPLEFAWVPPGTFTMGGTPAWLDRELPVRQVTLSRGLWMSTTTVTRSHWADFEPGRFAEPSDLPATGISFRDAEAFCGFLTERDGVLHRLPTEAEWERAARGGVEGAQYPWGDAPIGPERCNYGLPAPVVVASHPPNPYGLYDMVGNVQEWTSDPFAERAYDGPAAVVDPQGPSAPDAGLPLRAVRGGLCGGDVCEVMCRVSFRLGVMEEYAGHSMGLRVVREGA
mgnify:FL=1